MAEVVRLRVFQTEHSMYEGSGIGQGLTKGDPEGKVERIEHRAAEESPKQGRAV